MNPRIAAHQDLIGSWVVFDPTGRGLKSHLVVGRVDSVRWDNADDGNADGSPRPVMTVIVNGTEEVFGVVTVEQVLARH